MNTVLNVEMLPGTEFIPACQEAIILANQLNVYVRFKFNDASMLIKPGETLKEVMKRYPYPIVDLKGVEGLGS